MHGVWEWDAKKQQPVVLKEKYFEILPSEQREVRLFECPPDRCYADPNAHSRLTGIRTATTLSLRSGQNGSDATLERTKSCSWKAFLTRYAPKRIFSLTDPFMRDKYSFARVHGLQNINRIIWSTPHTGTT